MNRMDIEAALAQNPAFKNLITCATQVAAASATKYSNIASELVESEKQKLLALRRSLKQSQGNIAIFGDAMETMGVTLQKLGADTSALVEQAKTLLHSMPGSFFLLNKKSSLDVISNVLNRPEFVAQIINAFPDSSCADCSDCTDCTGSSESILGSSSANLCKKIRTLEIVTIILAFLGSVVLAVSDENLEPVILFVVAYEFVILILEVVISLLSYKSCMAG